MSDLDKLPTPEEMEAAFGQDTKTSRPQRKYPVNTSPRVIAIDPMSNSELPPQQYSPDEDDDSDEDRKPRRRARRNDDDFEMPDKFKDKSPEEIARSYAELERKFGTITNEVGHMRNIVEKLATQKRSDDLGDDDSDSISITSDELLSNPVEAIRKVTEASRKKDDDDTRKSVEQLRAEREMEKFEAKHPTFKEDMNDPDFQEFYQKSNYRMRLAQNAAQGDLEAAYELWDAWDEVRESVKGRNRRDEDQDLDDEDLEAQPRRRRAAPSMERGGRNGGGSKAFGKRIYSADDLVQLRLNDPDRYYSDAMQAVIQQAYREGRVK